MGPPSHRPIRHFPVVLVLAALGTGCAHHKEVYWPCSYWASEPAEFEATENSPGRLVVDLSAVGPANDPSLNIVEDHELAGYRPLSGYEVRCLAAENSQRANALTNERSAVSAQSSKRSSESINLFADWLELHADHERNRSAAAALESYYRLAEAEAGGRSLERSLRAIDDAVEEIGEVRQTGLPLDVDLTEFERQRLDLIDKQTEAHLALNRLNSQLQFLLGRGFREDVRIWPNAVLDVVTERINVDAEIQVALFNRSDVQALRQLGARLNSATLPAIKQAVGAAAAPMMGGLLLDVERRKLFALESGVIDELELRHSQIAQLVADQERLVAEEVRTAAYTVESRLRQIAIAKEKAATWQRRIDRLREQWESGTVDLLLLREAELKSIEADQDLLHSVIEWKIAQVKLWEAQGLANAGCEGIAECGMRNAD
ncbi:MAG: TolC family protein [Pirellulaceae bacterium]